MRDGDEPSPFMVFMNVTNTLTHLFLGAIAMSAYIFAFRFAGSNHLLQHIQLCVAGYVILMAEAILTFSPHTGWSRSLRYQQKRVSHLVMQIIGATLAITGSIIRIVNVENNFQTAHGILGLIALLLTILSLIGGVINLYTKKTVFTKIIHSCAGSLTLVAAFMCLCFGLDNTIFRNLMTDTVANLTISLTVIALVGTLMAPSFSNGKRLFN